MRRAYRAGAAVAATATLLTGAGFATLRDPARPAPAAAVSDTSPAAAPDELAALREEAAALKAEIAARRQALTTTPEDSSATTATHTGKAPATDATTGASGAGDDDEYGEDEERGDDD
jgi:hypothetical protein